MSLANIKTKLQSQEGFTIVELLIVVVVIAILAAITIVSYNGITARANSSSAQSAASNVLKKIETYASLPENSGYPTTFGALTAPGSSTQPFFVTGVTITGTAISAQPSSPSTVNVLRCPASGTITGMQVRYWKYDGTPAAEVLSTGTTTGCTLLTS